MTTETTKPSEHFTQHHDVEPPRIDARSFRQGWRIRTRLDALLADKRITAGEWQAACEYRNAYANVERIGGSSLVVTVRNAVRDHDYAMLTRIDDAARIHEAESGLTSASFNLCYSCIVLDQSWASIARETRCNPETARDRTVIAIRALAEAWNA